LCVQTAGHLSRQVIVVNDGSHDERYAAVAARHRAEIDYLVLPRNMGAAAARNAGAASAHHEYLVFVDDDCAAPAGWLDWLEAILAENSDLDAVAGTTRPLPLARPGVLGKFVGECSFHPMPEILENGALMMVTACLAVRRTRFVAIGGFDETLATQEDYDLSRRLLRRGAILYLAPSWHVLHDVATTLRQHLRRHYGYGRGRRRGPLPAGALRDDEWPQFRPSPSLSFEQLREGIKRVRGQSNYPSQPVAVRAIWLLLGLLTRLAWLWGHVHRRRAARLNPQEAR
jgi:GT2 family glycosyltransferase